MPAQPSRVWWSPLGMRPDRVTIDDKNRLTYQVAAGSGSASEQARTIVLDGTWRLSRDQTVVFSAHDAARHERRRIFLKGAIERVGAHSLAVAFAQDETGGHPAQTVTLRGRWQADAKNRLTFLAEKADGSEDRLVLQGGWTLGPHHELIYQYRRRVAGGTAGAQRRLVFNGTWDLARAGRVAYRLEGAGDEAFEFRASLQRPSVPARAGRIAYEIGVGLAGGRARRQRLTFYGTWKLHRDLAATFEIPYADGRVTGVRFEGAARLTSTDRIAVALSDSRRTPLGLTVTFTRELVPDASLFLELKRTAEETSAIGGVRVRF